MNHAIIVFWIPSALFLILAIIFTSLHKKCDPGDDDCEKKQKTYKKCLIAFWTLFAIFFTVALIEDGSPIWDLLKSSKKPSPTPTQPARRTSYINPWGPAHSI